MKKILLALSLIGTMAISSMNLSAQATEETHEVKFGYFNPTWSLSEFPLRTVGNNFAGQDGGMIYLPEEIVAQYNKGKITHVHIVSGGVSKGTEENKITDAELIFREQIDGRSFYHQSIVFGSKPKTWNDFELNTPVEIEEGRPFYCGFTCESLENDVLPLCFSGMKEENPNIGWSYLPTGVWSDVSSYYGALMLQLTIVMPGPGTDVENIAEAKPYANGLQGEISLRGDFNKALVFDMRGVKVAETSKAGNIALSKGVYLVNFDKSTTAKVVVK